MDYNDFLNDDWETVKCFITRNTNLQSLLVSASEQALFNIIKGLLSLPNPPKVHHNNYFALRKAAEKGHLDVVEYFIKDDIDIMKESVYSGNADLVEFCLARDMKVCIHSIRSCSEAGNIGITKRLLDLHPEYAVEAFISAFMREEVDLMTALLSEQYVSPHYALKSHTLPPAIFELATNLAYILEEKSTLNCIHAIKPSASIKL